MNLPLTHSMPAVSFYTPRHQGASGFVMFSGGTERDRWHEMGQHSNQTNSAGPFSIQQKKLTYFSQYSISVTLKNSENQRFPDIFRV